MRQPILLLMHYNLKSIKYLLVVNFNGLKNLTQNALKLKVKGMYINVVYLILAIKLKSIYNLLKLDMMV